MNTLLGIAAPLGAASAGICAMLYATFWPSCTLWGDLTWRGPIDSNRIALTFDDGPTVGTTDRLLDVLRDHQTRATFFVVGQNAQCHPDLLRRIDADGHLIGNHSFHHSHVGFMRTGRYWQREIEQTDDAISSITGRRSTIFRPPMGFKTWTVMRAARREGQSIVTWSRRAIDGVRTSPRHILARFENVRGGDILLLHDGVEPNAFHSDRTATIEAVGPLIESLRARGLEPVRLDELLGIATVPRRERAEQHV